MQIKRLVLGPLSTNCYILTTDKEALVIDSGSGWQEILGEVGDKEVTGIVLTHYHWDHTIEAPKLRKKTQSKILVGEKEKDLINFRPDILLREGDKVEVGNQILKIIHTPGHTPGSICLLGPGFLFSGDTLFKEGVGRTDLPGGSWQDLKKSLQKLEKIMSRGMKIYPGHGSPFEYP